MVTDEIFDHRVNRLISFGRAMLAGVSLVATWLDPAHADIRVYAVLAGYAAYALALAVLQWLGRLALPHWGAVTHLLDLLVFAALLSLTDGPTSPSFPCWCSRSLQPRCAGNSAARSRRLWCCSRSSYRWG